MWVWIIQEKQYILRYLLQFNPTHLKNFGAQVINNVDFMYVNYQIQQNTTYSYMVHEHVDYIIYTSSQTTWL